MRLFPRRRPTPTPTPAPQATPQTWTPEGTTVTQRYLGLAGATVLVYSSGSLYFAASCLGCTYQAATDQELREAKAAELANAHAAQCRALPRGVPERPDDATAATIVRTRVRELQRYVDERHFTLDDFLADRVYLQRGRDWILAALIDLAEREPQVLKVTVGRPSESGNTYTYLTALPRQSCTTTSDWR
ncbi:hypothetical protein [Streptomyces xiamenensis]|uniref:hypothetical protein n=1 Tax=Streptomyces xiamenensis TaxID=408015 RepID=UPI0035DD277F